MTHELAWVQRTDAGYEGECTCGHRFKHGRRESIETMHERHVHIEELREIVKQGKGVGE